MHRGHHVHAVHFDDGFRGGAQRDMEHRPALGRINPPAGEHGLDLFPQPRPFGQGDQQFHRLGGDSVLGKVEVKAVSLRGERLAPAWIIVKKAAQMNTCEL